jgi:Fic family protein
MSKWIQQRWEPNFGAFGGQKSRAAYAYRAFVPDPIGDLDVLFPGDIAEAMTAAEREVLALNASPPRFESLEALARQLLRAESVASSRIEGLELSHRRLARAAFTSEAAPRDITASSVVANIHAMETAIDLATRSAAITVEDILVIHRRLFRAAKGDEHAGIFREEQNWIGGFASGPRDAEFVPPPPEHVPALMQDLCLFLQREDVPAVALAAIAHAQFETIHPFADGNGRVGRCLIHIVLKRREIAQRYVPPISLVLASNSKAYIGGLTEYRAGGVQEWCGVFAAAVRTAALAAQGFGLRIAELESAWRKSVGSPRADSTTAKLLTKLAAYPIFNLKTVEEVVGVSNQAARLAVEQLETAGVVQQISAGKRNRAWEAQGIFELLNEFDRGLATDAVTGRRRPSPRR